MDLGGLSVLDSLDLFTFVEREEQEREDGGDSNDGDEETEDGSDAGFVERGLVGGEKQGSDDVLRRRKESARGVSSCLLSPLSSLSLRRKERKKRTHTNGGSNLVHSHHCTLTSWKRGKRKDASVLVSLASLVETLERERRANLLRLSSDVGTQPSDDERVSSEEEGDEAGGNEKRTRRRVSSVERKAGRKGGRRGSLVTEEERSVVSLSRKSVEHGGSSDARKNDGSDDGRLDSESNGEVRGEDDDEDLKGTEGDVEKDSDPGGESNTADNQGTELRRRRKGKRSAGRLRRLSR